MPHVFQSYYANSGMLSVRQQHCEQIKKIQIDTDLLSKTMDVDLDPATIIKATWR